MTPIPWLSDFVSFKLATRSEHKGVGPGPGALVTVAAKAKEYMAMIMVIVKNNMNVFLDFIFCSSYVFEFRNQ
jgi:hypothetical protein